ncbi:MAG: sensor domain-containing diguanylate cyclase [Deltaproteobacteria bacterium]|nr:sensor domain-containing diguanylate cyclase [Deltaproteobacteria bacterium]
MTPSRLILPVISVAAAGFLAVSLAGGGWPAVAAGVLTVAGLTILHVVLVVRPMRRILRLAERCLAGEELLPRLDPARTGALAPVAQAFGRLAGRINELKVDVVDAGRELEWTQEELALKETLEKKNRIIEETNLQLESRIRELSLLFSASRLFSSSLRLDEVLGNLCRMVGQTLSIDRFVVYLREDDPQTFTARGSFGLEGNLEELARSSLQQAEILRTVSRDRRSIYIRDLTKDPRSRYLHERYSLSGCLLAIPVTAAGEVIGVMYFNRPEVDAFRIDELSLLQVVSNIAAIAIRNASLYEITEELSVLDPLTGLLNRRALNRVLDEEWERARRFETSLAVLMIDVDRFKQFNDEHGHAVGDLVLKATAGGLGEELRKVDKLGRFGGEEFLAVLPRTDREQARAVAEKLRQRVASTTHLHPGGEDRAPLHITLSIGVACSSQGATSIQDLLDMADHALLAAKHAGRDRVEVSPRGT